MESAKGAGFDTEFDTDVYQTIKHYGYYAVGLIRVSSSQFSTMDTA